MLSYLEGRRVPVPLEFLDSEGLRAAVRASEPQRPLGAAEYDELVETLEGWLPGTPSWQSAWGEMFPGLIAHALGVQLEIHRRGYIDRIGPATGLTVVIHYDGDGHYDASRRR